MQMKDDGEDGQIQGKVRRAVLWERAREIAFLEKILIATEPRMVFNVMLVTQLWGIVSRWVKYMQKNRQRLALEVVVSNVLYSLRVVLADDSFPLPGQLLDGFHLAQHIAHLFP